MGKKILRTLVNNLGFKILAVIFAFALWLTVYNMEDPNKSKQFTVTVTVENADYPQSLSTPEYANYDTIDVSFYATGSRSVIQSLKSSDFTAVADMKNIETENGGETGKVYIKIDAGKYEDSVKITHQSKQYLEVSFEKYVSKMVDITPVQSGSCADGYVVESVAVDAPTVVTVSGPESEVKKVDKAGAVVNVDGVSSDFTKYVAIKLYDEDNKEIDSAKIEKDEDKASVKVTVLSTKEVKLNFNTYGRPASNYNVVGTTAEINGIEVSSVLIKGSAAALNEIDSIDIPGSVLNITGKSENFSKTIDISGYLPDGISLVDSDDATVKVTVVIESYGTKTYVLNTKNITVDGLSDGYEYEFDTDSVNVVVAASAENLSKLKSSNIKGTIDLAGLSPGSHTVTISLNIDEDKYSFGTVNIKVTITKIEENESNDDLEAEDEDAQ